MTNAENYSIQIKKGIFSDEECYQATVLEFPDLHEYADSHEEAYDLIIDSIETTIEILTEKSRPVPQPMADCSEYNGRVTLRMPKTLHKQLDGLSKKENTSMNQYMVTLLAFAIGYEKAARKTHSMMATININLPSVTEFGFGGTIFDHEANTKRAIPILLRGDQYAYA